MAITFDAAAQRIILDSFATTATEIYSRWVDWAATADNLKYGMVIRQVGGDDLGSGLNIPPYYFLQGGWRVRPQEASGLTVITGNLFVEGGGSPVVNTLGAFSSQVQFTVPVQAQGFDSGAGGGGGGATAADIWSYGSRTLTAVPPGSLTAAQVWAHVTRTLTEAVSGGLSPTEATQLAEIWKLHGLDLTNPLTVTPTSRAVDTITQTIVGDAAVSLVVTRT
jgi:hypothetical protein